VVVVVVVVVLVVIVFVVVVTHEFLIVGRCSKITPQSHKSDGHKLER